MAMGRPKKEFDWSKFDAICSYNAELNDAAEIMGVHPDTIAKKLRKEYDCTFSEYRDKKLGRVRIKLVQKAIDMATSGNATMMIFCLKNLCKWSDRTEIAPPSNKSFKLSYSTEKQEDGE